MSKQLENLLRAWPVIFAILAQTWYLSATLTGLEKDVAAVQKQADECVKRVERLENKIWPQ